MKKYTEPNAEIIEFFVEDIMHPDSGEEADTDYSDTEMEQSGNLLGSFMKNNSSENSNSGSNWQ